MPVAKRKLLPPFTEAIVICAVFWFLALVVVPEVRSILEESGEGPPLHAVTKAILTMSPVGIIIISLVLGIATSLGRVRPDCRWISRCALILTLTFGVMILVGLSLPFIGG